MKESGLQRFLQGKQIPIVPGKVDQVLKFGSLKRIVIDQQGNRTVVTKGRLIKAFNTVLAKEQQHAMLKTVRERKDLTATAMLGGLERGELKVYSSAANARRAIRRHYHG
jgi:hypothetical protein